MSKIILKRVMMVLMVAAFLSGVGCKNSSVMGSSQLKLPELGLTMQTPAGWTRDKFYLCHKGEYNTGVLMVESLAGKSLDEVARKISTEFGSQILSSNEMTVDGHRVIVNHIKATTGAHALDAYLARGDKVAVITFTLVSKDVYDQCENGLLKSLKTIKLK